MILPFLEEGELYWRFHLDEAWDSPHNETLLTEMPKLYAARPEIVAPDDRTMTFYQVFVGVGAAFEGDKGSRLKSDFPDGAEQTILVVEAREPVPWTAPMDLPYSPDQSLPALGAPRRYQLGRLKYGQYFPQTFAAATADATARPFNMDMPPETLRGWITRTGGEKLIDE